MKIKTVLKLTKEISPTKFFIIIAAVFGLLFLFLTPPFETPDEGVHFYRSYQISQGNLIIDTGHSTAGGMLPTSLGKIINITTDSHSIEFHPEKTYRSSLTREALHVKEHPENKIFYDFSATAFYSVVSYAPQAAGILIARSFHAPPLLMMYAGRVMNLVAWILLLALSIRLIPFNKWLLVAIGLLPMALFQAVSLGADVMTIGLTALTLSLILYYRERNTLLTRRDYFYLCITLIGLVMSKQIMFLCLPLILLIPTRLFGARTNLRSQLIRMLIATIPLIIFGLWFAIVSTINYPIISMFNPNPSAQIKFIVTHPLGYLAVLFRTYFLMYSDGVARSFIGTFGWMDTPLSEFWATFGYLGLALLAFGHTDRPKEWLGKFQKIILVLVIVALFLVISTALYVYYDAVHYKEIVGLQGRYFIPIALLAIPLLSGIVKVKTSLYKSTAFLLPILLLSASVITLFYRYYIGFKS